MEAALNGPNGRVSLGAGVLTIGRAPDNQVTLADPQVSSHHAEIRPEGQGYSVVDKGSTNGTFVNDQRIDGFVPRVLNPGDRVRFGNTTFTYEGGGAAGSYEPTVMAGPGVGLPGGSAPIGYEPVPSNYGPAASPYGGFNAPQPPPAVPPYPAQQPPAYPAQPPAYPVQPPPMPGAGVPPVPGGYYGQPMQQPRKSRAGCIAGVVVLILLVLIGGGVLAFAPFSPFVSTPEKTLNAFWGALKNNDTHTAYSLLSQAEQAKQGGESKFSTGWQEATTLLGPLTDYTISNVQQSGDHATANVTLTFQKSPKPEPGTMGLIKENGSWKVDKAPNSTSS